MDKEKAKYNDNYCCPVDDCAKVYMHRASLKRHLLQTHNLALDKPNRMNDEERLQSRKKTLRKHYLKIKKIKQAELQLETQRKEQMKAYHSFLDMNEIHSQYHSDSEDSIGPGSY